MTFVKLRVDFGDASDEQLLPVLPTVEVTAGLAVLLFDGEGNLCGGTVERVEPHLAWVRPNWETWVPAVIPSVGMNCGRTFWVAQGSATPKVGRGTWGTGQEQTTGHADPFRSAVPA